ncbi:glucosamine-6-phosphate deaminase [Dyadobacter sp. NIV53]|uniref:glucosamine-6-phosphate deaminase n=1 Tax=Dyadobacter sp. NIV53 TaxID=2861765 RepID=UPI001C877D37|nr:glucosamine-6-phosphate deaminase [Dyadobacter sp. NIV53]
MPPKISIYNDYTTLSQAAANQVIALLRQKPTAVICLPSGSTPLGLFQELVAAHISGETDFTKCTFIGLDEWIGLGANDDGSCRDLLDKDFLLPIGFREDQITFFDGLAKDPQTECERVNDAIAKAGGLDLIILGVGMNGHLALNEPGTAFDTYAHVSELDTITKEVGQKYFNQATELKLGITVGIRHILEAKKAILIASGKAKAPVIQRALSLPVTTDFPASILQEHSDSEFILDKEAGELLQ